MKKRTRGLVIFAVLASLASLGLMLGAVSSKTMMAFAQDRYEQLQTFSKVLNLVQEYYVEEVSVDKLIQGAIKGMLGELDPHTNYMPKEIFQKFQDETSGDFRGLGIEISIQNEILTIISPIDDTPAYEAGIKAGDKIISINGESTKGMTLVDAAQRIKGKMGEKISLEIFREGFDKTKEFIITRRKIKIRSIKPTDLEDGYLYIRMTSFIERTAADLKKAIEDHQKKYKETKGLLIDLRNNPGGLLQQAVDISDMFLEEGMIVSIVKRNAKDKETYYARKEGTLGGFPIILLVNEYSASSSEIFAGALQDNKRALVMGQRTFGKGTVQSAVRLGDGSGLKLTIGKHYKPSGGSIQADGVEPDVSIENVNPEAFEKAIVSRSIRREKDIEGHLIGEREGKKGVKKKLEVGDLEWYKHVRSQKNQELSPRDKLLSKDFQVLQAYNYLKAWKVFDKISK